MPNRLGAMYSLFLFDTDSGVQKVVQCSAAPVDTLLRCSFLEKSYFLLAVVANGFLVISPTIAYSSFDTFFESNQLGDFPQSHVWYPHH